MHDVAESESSVRAALRANTSTRDWADADLEPLASGFNNQSWRMWWQGVPYVVRLNRADSASLGIDRASELALVQAAAAAGLAPPVVASDLQRGVLVLRYVEGRTWTAEDARMPVNLGRLAQVVSRLHDIAPPSQVRRRSFREQAERLERVCGGTQIAPDPVLAQRARPVFTRLDAANPRLTLCHDDLHHLNVVDDGERLVLIDWEYGGLGDPAFDLASVIVYHELDAAGRRPLLDAYDRSDPRERENVLDRLDAAIWAFDYVQWLWYLAAARGGSDQAVECVKRAAEIRARLA